MKQVVVKAGQRYNPAAVWEKVNPILIEGEMGIESDTGLFKFGDGVTPWKNLRYAGGGGSGGQVDTTLTKAGQAADAAATGKAIQEVDEKMFTGTIAEYQAAYQAGKIPIGTVVNLTDDENEGLGGVVVVTKLPLAQENYRGRAIILESNGVDTLQLCLKKSGSYNWYQTTLGDVGETGTGEEIGKTEAAGKVGTVMVVQQLPLAQSFYRGKSLVLERDGVDTLQICLKNGDNYYWYEQKTSEQGESGGDTKPALTTPVITLEDIMLETAILGSAILGQMILGKET